MALPMSVPAHSSLMKPAAEKLRIRLEAHARGGAFRGEGLRRGLQDPYECERYSRRLGETVADTGVLGGDRAHHDFGGATQIIECGPGKVLTALNRRMDKNRDLKMLALEDPQAFDDALAAVA